MFLCRELSRDREREKKRDQEDEEEAYERRKLERKLRDKEAAYQEVGKAEIIKGADNNHVFQDVRCALQHRHHSASGRFLTLRIYVNILHIIVFVKAFKKLGAEGEEKSQRLCQRDWKRRWTQTGNGEKTNRKLPKYRTVSKYMILKILYLN